MNVRPNISRLVLSAAVVLATAVTPLSATAAMPQVAPNVFSAQSGTASVQAGQIFVVALPANRTTGYSWGAPQFDHSGVATVVGTTYQAPNSMPGAGGTQFFVLKAMAAGTATLTVRYARPWEKNAKPARTATLKITVNGV